MNEHGNSSGKFLKVLFVDDDVVMQKLLATALRKSFEVVGELSGANVIEKCETVRPDVILLDLSMPEVDGFEVLAHLKSHASLSSIPVICLSGHIEQESRTRALRAGAVGFMAKPIDILKIGPDIEHLLKSVDTEIISLDSKRSVFIGRNSQTSHERMKMAIRSTLDQGKKALVLSANSGEAFFSNFDKEPLKSGQLAYLEIKPSLIVRLPYLDNLSSITEDFRALLPGGFREYQLFFDGPEQILNILDQDKSAATIVSFGDYLAKTFPKAYFFVRYSDDQTMNRHVNSMAKLLARVA